MFGNTFHGRISRTSHLILPCLFALIYLILFSPPGLNAAQVTLAWDPSTDPHVTGFRLYYGTSSRSYQFKDDAGINTTFTISNLQDGTTYYFAVTARDAAGIESEYSNEISYSPTPTATCQYSISPASQSVGFLGGPRTLSVSSQPDCTWTAVSNVSWLVITSNSSGRGNGTVNYSVNANSSSSSRKGKMTVAGQTFTISQKSSTYYTTERGNSGN